MANKLSNILKRLMFENSMKTMQLARITQLPQPTVQRMVAGVTTNPHSSSLRPIADFFGLSVDQLKGDEPIPQFESAQILPNGVKQIPIIPWQNHSTTENSAANLLWVEEKISSKAFAVVLGDASMFPIFSQGTIVIVDPDKPAKDRSYILVELKNHPTLVFRQLIIDANQRYLKSLSPDLENFPLLPLTAEDKIRGVMVQARRDYEE